MTLETQIASLVDTYKELNMKFRKHGDNPQMRAIVERMRDDEIAFSQALKDSLSGIGTDTGEPGTVDGEANSFDQIISQFGSARATTLNLLKGVHDFSVLSNTAEDGMSLEQHINELVESDRNQLQRLSDLARA